MTTESKNMNPYAMFETDRNLEKEGIWIDYGPFSFKVARAGGSNEKYRRMLQHRMKPYRRQIQNETMSEEKAQEIILETFVDAVLLDWKDVRDRDGNVMDFNRENALQLLSDLRDLFADLQTQSQKIANFRREEMETDLGK